MSNADEKAFMEALAQTCFFARMIEAGKPFLKDNKGASELAVAAQDDLLKRAQDLINKQAAEMTRVFFEEVKNELVRREDEDRAKQLHDAAQK